MNTTRKQVAKLLGTIAIVGVVGALFVWFRPPSAPAITAPAPAGSMGQFYKVLVQ